MGQRRSSSPGSASGVTPHGMKMQLQRNGALKAYLEKVRRDNIRFLVAAVAWHVLISVVPITVGMIALTGLVFRSQAQQRAIVHQLSQALQGVLSPGYLERLTDLMIRHNGPFAIVAALAVLWAAEQVGFALDSACQAMFEVRSRPFLREKLIHLGMFFVFVALMLIIVGATSARAALTHSIAHSQVPNVLEAPVTTAVSLAAAFLLFATVYMVYPHTHKRLKLEHVWQGALLAAVLFQALTYIWPVYISHFSRYGGILFPILVLILWIYFFSFILVAGAEVVAIGSIREAEEQGEEVGPAPDGTVPQHRMLRERHPSAPA